MTSPLAELQTIERRLEERLIEAGKNRRSTVRYSDDDESNYGAWISTHGVEVEVDEWEHLDAARAILLDAGFSVPDLEEDNESGDRLIQLGFIRVIYPGKHTDREFSIELHRRPTDAQVYALGRVVRRAHRLHGSPLDRNMWIDYRGAKYKSERCRPDVESILAAIGSK
jgi:hypothetical protein